MSVCRYSLLFVTININTHANRSYQTFKKLKITYIIYTYSALFLFLKFLNKHLSNRIITYSNITALFFCATVIS